MNDLGQFESDEEIENYAKDIASLVFMFIWIPIIIWIAYSYLK